MILNKIVSDKKKRLIQHKQKNGESEMKLKAYRIKREGNSFYDALVKPGLSIIGEFKKASPSTGVIENKLDLLGRIEQYNASVDAISCLTEEDHFHGGVEYFEKIRKITDLPMIRKDFIIEDYQIYEAKVIGADAVLLIAAILSDTELIRLYDTAYSLDMDVLVEVHDLAELERVLELDVKIIGINNRNLKDFSINLETTRFLAEKIPAGKVIVSESGVTREGDIEFLRQCNVDALLIGRAFMESEEPEVLAKSWKDIYNGSRVMQ